MRDEFRLILLISDRECSLWLPAPPTQSILRSPEPNSLVPFILKGAYCEEGYVFVCMVGDIARGYTFGTATARVLLSNSEGIWPGGAHLRWVEH